MKNFIALFAFCLASASLHAQIVEDTCVLDKYEFELQQLVEQRDQTIEDFQNSSETTTLNPYYYRIITPVAYYSQSTHQVMGIDWYQRGNSMYQHSPILNATEATDYVLAYLYASRPQLVPRTESMIKAEPALRKDIKAPVTVLEPKLSDKAVVVDLGADVPDSISIVAKKPNFWKVLGTASLQFTQSYFSDNWYQGGENNYSGIGMLTIEANYDNKKKVQWDNKFEAQLGFQTATNDEHKARVTSNLLRLTSKIGYKAIKNWFYTGQLMTNTQIAPYYEKNPRKDDGSYDVKPWKARFGTPWYLTLSVGMDYKFKSKNEKVELSVYLSPVAYYMTYVERLGAAFGPAASLTVNPRYYGDMYGINKNADGLYTSHSFHKFGPNFTVNSKIKVMKNVQWTSRLYWFSNFHSTLIEWENTVDFTINKYISAKFYAYPRFDDASPKYKNTKKHRGDYLMFKEWLSLGLSYKF